MPQITGLPSRQIPASSTNEDAVEDVLKHGSELTIGSVGGAVAGALLQPDEAEIQGEEQHAKADADEQSRDESTGKPGGIDSRTERKKKQARRQQEQEQRTETEPQGRAVDRQKGRTELVRNRHGAPSCWQQTAHRLPSSIVTGW